MKKLLLGLVFVSLANLSAFAQTVGTIGVGDITYSVTNKQGDRAKENVVSAIDSGIGAALLSTRKFTVLDFAQLKTRIEAQGLKLEEYYKKSYTGTEYLQAGLDYILTADITEFGLFKRKRGSVENSVGLVDIDFKLIGVADVTRDFESKVSAQYLLPAGSSESKDDILDKTIERAVDQLVDQVISRLFPIRVMKIEESGTITLNYGEGLLEPGDTILLYPLGQNIVINADGDALGESIATLQVITTERKFAKAQALDGLAAVKKGQQGQLLLN